MKKWVMGSGWWVEKERINAEGAEAQSSQRRDERRKRSKRRSCQKGRRQKEKADPSPCKKRGIRDDNFLFGRTSDEDVNRAFLLAIWCWLQFEAGCDLVESGGTES